MGSNWDFQSAVQSALALILLALGLMVWDQEVAVGPKGSIHETRPNVFSQDTVASINKHLQWTEKQTELNAVATDVENRELAPPAARGAPIEILPPAMNPFETEDASGQVIRDLELNAGRVESPRLPAERINSIIEQKQWMNTYNKKQTEEFLRAVRENARAAGYQIEISDQLKVTNVQRLPNQVVDDARPAGSR